MKSLKYWIKEANKNNYAIGHFNVSNIEMLYGVYNAGRKLSEERGEKIPIIIGVSEKERDFLGKEEIALLVRNIRERDSYPIFLNADHHYSFEKVKEVVDLGYDAFVIDGTKLPIEENINLTRKCVDYARKIEEQTGQSVITESELGFIGDSSKLLDKIPEGVSEETMTKPEDARIFVQETGIDLLAPSVGNIHGIVKTGNPKLDIGRIKEIKEVCKIPLVLHGGSGITDKEFSEAIKAGISIIHISTELRVAYRNALKKELEVSPGEIAPYKYLSPAMKAVEEVAYKRLKLFNFIP